MKTALIIGATGLVGTQLTKQLSEDPRYQRIIVWGRHLTGNNTDKIEDIIVDFNQIETQSPDSTIDEVFCALGTTIKDAGSQTNFKKVDYDYVLAVAKWAKKSEIPSFNHVSALGANASSRVFYSRIKGELEHALKSLNFTHLTLMRPSLLKGPRPTTRRGEKWAQIALTLLKPGLRGALYKYRAITGQRVAKAMIHYANNATESVLVVEGQQFYRHEFSSIE